MKSRSEKAGSVTGERSRDFPGRGLIASRIRRRMLFAALLTAGAGPSAAPDGALEVTADDFRCISEMTPVRGFYVDNLQGDLEATLEVAESEDGGVYPPGTVIQLVPGEVMVKHPEGHSPATRNWEFIELDVAPEGARIRARGYADVVNRFGGNCFGCHVQAEPEWDLVCEQDHGCDPIPLTRPMVEVLQKADPRCDSASELTPGELELLQALSAAG